MLAEADATVATVLLLQLLRTVQQCHMLITSLEALPIMLTPVGWPCALSPTGIAENSHLRKQNYFYYNCITGHFLRDNCPSYLREENFNRLKDGLINRLTISSGFFLDELRARKYSKVRFHLI